MKTWKADKAHSKFGFRVKHMMFSKVDGHFTAYKATVEMENDDFENAQLNFEAQSNSITTHNEDRDKHLKSQDFFNAEKNPTIAFKSTKIEKKDDNTYVVEGDLSANGVTKAIQLDTQFSGSMKDPWGAEIIGLSLTGKINRKDWGMEWNQALESGGVLVGKNVELEVQTEMK